MRASVLKSHKWKVGPGRLRINERPFVRWIEGRLLHRIAVRLWINGRLLPRSWTGLRRDWLRHARRNVPYALQFRGHSCRRPMLNPVVSPERTRWVGTPELGTQRCWTWSGN